MLEYIDIGFVGFDSLVASGASDEDGTTPTEAAGSFPPSRSSVCDPILWLAPLKL